MLEGLYSAAAGMEAQQTQLDAISNDVANSDTPGYQATEVGFHDLLYGSDNDPLSQGTVGSGAAATTIGYSQAQGQIEQTGNPLDVAIAGNAYLEVKQPNGTIGLTRNGTLQVDSTGRLTTTLGMPVQPPITIPKGTDPSKVTISSDGTVSAGQTKLGKLQLVTVTAPNQLLEAGDGVFSATSASGPLVNATGATLQQGALEQSNVDMNAEISQMMATEQAYSMASKAIDFETQMGQIASTLKT
jgi:flagellar basal-body rod protein FlgG